MPFNMMMDVERGSVRLFSYGTLRQQEVQQATFGRLLEGRPDAIVGFRLETLTITDPGVLAASGSDQHPILVADDSGRTIEGTVFDITAEELSAADGYEVDDYVRIEVPMRCGGTAWVYVQSGETGPT